jgi:hypothetical protein
MSNVDSDARILGKSPAARAKYLVARAEVSYVPANRFNLAGHISAEPGIFWFAHSGHEAKDVWQASHEVPVIWIDGSRSNFYQYFTVVGNRLVNVHDLDNVWGPVFGVDGGFH